MASTEAATSTRYPETSTAPNSTILPSNISSSSDCIDHELLYSHELFEHTNLVEKIFMFVCVVVTLFILADFISCIMYVVRHYNTGLGVKYRTCQILGIYPAVAVTSLFALFFPRADLLCELISTVYMSRAIFHFVSLMTLYFGGKKRLLHHIKDDKIALRSPPCCCCCCCLPSIPASDRNFTVLKILVLQAAIVLPVLTLTSVVLWLDGKYENGAMSPVDAFPYLTVPTIVSTLFSLYAYIMLYRLCRKYLASMSITVKFLSLQLVISLTRIETLLMSILAANGIPACRGALSTLTLSQTYKQIVIILEMFLLSLLARRVYRDPHDEVAKFIAMEAEVEAEMTKPDVERADVETTLKNGNDPQPSVETQPLSIRDTNDDSQESKI